MTRAITSALMNYETIHLSGNISYELKVLKAKLNVVKTNNTQSFSLPDLISFGQWTIIGGGFVGLMLLTDKAPAINEFVALNFYLIQFMNLFNGFGDGINKMRAAIINLERISDIFERQPDISDNFPNQELQIKQKGAAITFENVSFSYDKKKAPTLNKLSFSIESGQKLGIVGLSGGGKSTIAKLLYRFYDITDGSIKIDGQAINQVSLNSLRSKIAIIPQSPTVFNDSLKNNIWYGAIPKRGEIVDEAILNEVIAKASLGSL